jgi:hypothetical protein
MKEMNDLVDQLVADIEETPTDAPVSYEVWAIGYDEEDKVTDAEMLLGTFDDPDMAVSYAKNLVLADVVNLAADDECDVTTEVHSISIEVETVVPGEEAPMNIGTVYKKTIEIFEELPEYVPLSADDYVLLENGDIMVSKNILPDYSENDYFTAIFEHGGVSQPMIYQIKSTVGETYICEFV